MNIKGKFLGQASGPQSLIFVTYWLCVWGNLHYLPGPVLSTIK